MVRVADRQITLLPIPSSASSPFSFFPKRGDQPPFFLVLPFSKTTRPRWCSFHLRQGSTKMVGVPLASPGNGHLETRSKSGRVASPSTVEETFRAILAFSQKEFSFLKFSRALGRVSWLIFHREDPAFKYGINGPRELLEGGVLFLLDGPLRRGRTLRGSKETGGRVDGNSNYVCASY